MENNIKYFGIVAGLLVGLYFIINWNEHFDTKQVNITVKLIDGTIYKKATLQQLNPISEWYTINDSIKVKIDNVQSIIEH